MGVEPKMPLSRLFFLSAGAGCCGSEMALFAPGVSGMLTVFAAVFRLSASKDFFATSSFFELGLSRAGEEEDFRDCWSCETIHDFLRSLDMERAGELLGGDSVCLAASLTASLRPRSAFLSAFRSVEGSRLLLEKGRNLDDRRELFAGRSWGICTASRSGPSSDEGLDPPELSEEPFPFVFR